MELKIIALVAVAVVALVVVGLPSAATKGDTNHRQLVADGGLLLDVRTPREFARRHLEGAVNIPVQELPNRLSELGDHARPVVVYCRSGNRSARAKRLLEGAGWERVVDIGTMSAW
jgi:rhodanese-related sulfurtransferase